MDMSPLKIGLLFPQSGPAGLWAPSAQLCAQLAAEEINATGGVMGRPVELIAADVGQTAQSAIDAARALRAQEIAVLVGMHPSDQRRAIAGTIGEHCPYVYTPQYEGGCIETNVIAIGETAYDLLPPSIDWLVQRRHAQRFYFVGNDYIWPHLAHRSAKRFVLSKGGKVVGESFLSFGLEDYDQVFAAIRASNADVVVLCLLGLEAIHFHRAFVAAGLDHHHLRLATATDETVLYAIGSESTHNLYVTTAYLSNLSTPNNERFIEHYYDRFGMHTPIPNALGESCYEGIHYLSTLMGQAGTCEAAALRQATRRRPQPHHSPRRFNGDARPNIYLATAVDLDFRLIAQFDS